MRSIMELAQLSDSVREDARKEWLRLSTLQKRIDGRLVRTWMPENADAEYKDLFRKSSSPWLAFVRDVLAQGCIIDGYSSEAVWESGWQANSFDGRQGEVTREAIGLGKSFILNLPTPDGGVMSRPVSSRNTFAVYRDPWDEYPEWVLIRLGKVTANFWDSDWAIVDEEAMYRFKGTPKNPRDLRVVEHALGYAPVVRISNTLALTGESQSSVEPMITTFQRIVDATFTLQMVQRYGAFPQKWMAGGELATDANGNTLVKSSVDGLLHASGDNGETARFGTFEPADLNQVVAAQQNHINDLLSLAQIPPHYLGRIVNMSAEGITAAESGYDRQINDRRQALGEGWELQARTQADILGDPSAADLGSEVHWADISSRSLAQVSDAISKLAALPEPPPLELLFALLPGWTKRDVLTASRQARETPALPAPAPVPIGQ